MWDDFAEFILTQSTKNPTKIVEVAVGKFDGVYQYLKRNENIEIIKTDILPNDNEVIKDDITNPNLDLYKNADIIYSIRPPSELQPYIEKLSHETNGMIIIKPLCNEDLNIGFHKAKLKNYKKASFYIL
ncbi:UPF0146 family protein [uncultured Methanobrevibacter sp.]|uniref:UPF0146 family protein n=1 Tax=uncultured Methanobrevibacter sp. TaxID=253161 RepID=UPI002633030D|nr:UPF0146 family protein [uncultured Methanobrevibacter sp.]